MALTITTPGNASDVSGVPGNNKYVIKRIQFDSSYPTNGESLTATDLGLESIHIVIIDTESSGYLAQYDYTNSKVEVYEAGADAAAGCAGAAGRAGPASVSLGGTGGVLAQPAIASTAARPNAHAARR